MLAGSVMRILLCLARMNLGICSVIEFVTPQQEAARDCQLGLSPFSCKGPVIPLPSFGTSEY